MKKIKKPFYKRIWFWIILVIIAGSALNGNNTKENTLSNNSNKEVVQTVEKEKDDVPWEYTSALKKAKTYSDMMYMSKQGIYDQLTSEYGENFPKEAAKYAIDNLKANWKENALKKAESYRDNMNMSKNQIYDQLTSDYGEKFTSKQAKYAIDNL